jgi:hypothetical protein
MNCTLARYYYSRQIKEDEIKGAFGTLGKEEKIK